MNQVEEAALTGRRRGKVCRRLRSGRARPDRRSRSVGRR